MAKKSVTIEDADAVVDVTGQVCAMPILTAADELRSAADGDLLALKTGKPVNECEDVENWATKLDGASLISTHATDDGIVALLRRRVAD